ncbi:MAG: NADH-quinone oxidoreductase subunit H [Candidatus Limnocylindria bacterium]|nr:NADH-quinone oxidoreductase subunit H [Candidatus Limnocylindria bacterium]
MIEAMLAIAQLALLVTIAPGLSGLIKTLKARVQGRRGPHPFQPYRELWKLLRKDTVVSAHASWVTRAAPLVYAGAIATAALLVPALWIPAPLGGWGDALALVGLFALARFALALAGLDQGSAFGGMGSSREVAVAALAEPALLLALFAVALRTGGTDLSATAATLAALGPAAITPGQLLALAAVAIVIAAETGRVPVDNPDTHLELTMIHEGMLLEYAGRPLGILVWATLLKQTVLFALLIAAFFPWGIAATGAGVPRAAAAFGAKLLCLAIGVALAESSQAKLRIFKVPELMGAAFFLALLAVVTDLVLA